VLAEIVAGLSPEERQALRPLVLKVWRALLRPQMQGTKRSSIDTFTIRSASLPSSDALVAIRDRAILGLLESWDQSSTVVQQREAFLALMEATDLPTHGDYSNELCAMILKDTKRIVDALADRLTGKSYDLIEHVEDRFLFQYRRARHIAENERDEFGCKEIASSLVTSLRAVRDRLNADSQYVRYKMLVGFETVLPPHWENKEFEIAGAQEYRNQRIMEYVNEISDATEDEWYKLILRCAATESDDLATFPVFSSFLAQLAKAKPETAIRFLRRADHYLARFLPTLLNGLSQSGAEDDYRALVKGYLSEGKHLWAIARHFQITATATPAEGKEILDKAVGACDDCRHSF